MKKELIGALSGVGFLGALLAFSPEAPKAPGRLPSVTPGGSFRLAPEPLPADPATLPDPDSATGRLLLKFRADVPSDRRNEILSAAGVRLVSELSPLGILEIESPAGAGEKETLDALMRRPEIEYAVADVIYRPSGTPDDPGFASQWTLPEINAPAAWDTTTGRSDIVIAFLDSGLDGSHPDLAANVVAGWNVYNNTANTADVTGHGTMVAGVAAAVGNNGTGIAGVVWHCAIMPIRVTSTSGGAAASAIAKGLVWAADHGARIANVSFAIAHRDPVIRDAARYFQGKGGVVVAAAAPSTTPYDFAHDSPAIISVGGASDDIGSVDCPMLSAMSNNVDVAAPGEKVYTTCRGGGYGTATGTSLAAAHVSGAAALLLSANSSLTPDQVDKILKITARDIVCTPAASGWDQCFGWGLIDVARAVALARSAPPTDAVPPSLVLSSPDPGATVSGTAILRILAADASDIASVSLYVDNFWLVTDTTAPHELPFRTTRFKNGTHAVLVVARDRAANEARLSLSLVIQNQDATPPVPAISAPQDGGIVTGTIKVLASATDNLAVASLSLDVDGSPLPHGTTLLSGYVNTPYADGLTDREFDFFSARFPNGPHVLTATATDYLGNVGKASITIITGNDVDTTPPRIPIAEPENGAALPEGENIPVTMWASDDTGIRFIAGSLNGRTVFEYDLFPQYLPGGSGGGAVVYAAEWLRGANTIRYRAIDGWGNETVVTHTVYVGESDTTAPSCSITNSPATYTTAQTVTISASASDNVGVTRVEFLRNGALVGSDTTSPYAFAWALSSSLNGSHSWTARAFDAAGNSAASSAVTLTVTIPVATDTIRPTVSITSPAKGAVVSGAISITANASDNVGVTKVVFYYFGKRIATDTAAPFAATWDTRTVPNGDYNIAAWAHDAAGNASGTFIKVTVRN